MTAKMVTVRAQLVSVTVHTKESPLDDARAPFTRQKPAETVVRLMGETGPIEMTLRPSLPAGFLSRDGRYEVTLRRLRKAPRKRAKR